eukprot:4980007-Pyramimonas_sp.AAC.1
MLKWAKEFWALLWGSGGSRVPPSRRRTPPRNPNLVTYRLGTQTWSLAHLLSEPRAVNVASSGSSLVA